MTEQDDQQQRESWNALGIRTDIPHPARVYDYMLGGKDNFAADRETAERSLQFVPDMPGLVLVSYWRPRGGVPVPNADRAWAYGGVAAV